MATAPMSTSIGQHAMMPVVVIMMMAMIILPLPGFVLDILFTFNIALSLLVLLAGIYTRRPLEFAIFPMVLLITTLLRLTLNIASTRIVLLKGHEGGAAAGQVIQSFGEVVIGSNFAVGLVVFAILVIINFVVITKGAGRVSEVSARFTLDAMPGKQMAIDADLNAGILTQEQAKKRREEIGMEADFYGAMDGASKFVRGDAIAGILILFINLVGGVLIGSLQHGLPFTESLRVYALLTIGDGLAAQVPSILLSTAAGIMVTRVSSEHDINQQFRLQILSNPQAPMIGAGIMFILGIIPGMPHVIFILMAGALYMMGSMIQQTQRREAIQEAQASVAAQSHPDQELPPDQAHQAPPDSEQDSEELTWDQLGTVDPVSLEIGYRLIPLVDEKKKGELIGRIKGIRKKLSSELGFLVPTVHISDNLNIQPNAYRLSLSGVALADHEVHPDKLLAINPGTVMGAIEGIKTIDPAFGLEALWINKNKKDQAQSSGYTVVDCATVIATHLSQVINDNAEVLLGHHEVEKLMENIEKVAPKLVDNLVPGTIPMAVIVKVLQNLLQEHIPVRDFKTIVETLAEVATKSQDPAILTEAVRASLARMIVHQLVGSAGDIPVMTLKPDLEQILLKTLEAGKKEELIIEPNMAAALHQEIERFYMEREQMNEAAIMLVSSNLRRFLARFVRGAVPHVSVLAYSEIPENKKIRVVSSLGQ